MVEMPALSNREFQKKFESHHQQSALYVHLYLS